MDTRTLIGLLNDDLAHEYAAVIQYLTYAARVSGPYRPELSKFFMAEVPDETRHAQTLANKIVALGGVPITSARPVPVPDGNRAMLEAVLSAESEAVRRYTQRSRQAEESGDKGLQVTLEDMVRDETDHRDETARILRDWPV
ncbi:MAG: ferritin-like domain-containing protein [Phycisphaeraceae bacterium]|nr:ferritin-like domain-containing protein [Phycisphaeraceae bacterium]